MRLTLIISSLGCGGAERVMSIMANYWAARGWNISLITLDGGRETPFYELDPRVRYRSLGAVGEPRNPMERFCNHVNRVRALRRAIRSRHPDAVISFMDKPNVMALLATRGLRVPVIVSERTDPAMHSIGRIPGRLRRWTYPLAELIVVQSKGAMAYFSTALQSRMRIIPNPVMPALTDRFPSDTHSVKPLLVAMGRLGREKGFDLLMRAFGRLKDKHLEWTLMILGEGPLRSELESMRDELGLADRVLLPGQVKNPNQVLAQADLFVMSSHFEGFPNALCEAMSYGLPVIATDCPSGPREIIRNGVDGVLVPRDNVDALAAAMDELMRSETRRKALAGRAPEVTRRLALDRVMPMWEEALDEILRLRSGQYVQSRSSAW